MTVPKINKLWSANCIAARQGDWMLVSLKGAPSVRNFSIATRLGCDVSFQWLVTRVIVDTPRLGFEVSCQLQVTREVNCPPRLGFEVSE